jgi:hypothetical protein
MQTQTIRPRRYVFDFQNKEVILSEFFGTFLIVLPADYHTGIEIPLACHFI